MNHRGLGFGLIAVAAFLFAMRFLCAAIHGISTSERYGPSFGPAYNDVGPDLTIAAALALAAGVYFLWRGEKEGK